MIKKNSHLPPAVRDALTVTYGTVKTNTESDLVGIIFPDDAVLDAFTGRYTGKSKAQIDEQIESRLGELSVCIIQCKTNWNDNAQIPMLWDMVYSATGFRASRASVGRNGHSIRSFKRFWYAFATVPSNKLEQFKPTSTPVLRLSNLSGGNYWGQPSQNGIAESIPDIFTKIFSEATQSLGMPWRNFLDGKLRLLSSEYSYFNL